jgi:hypothetical protein
MTDPSHETSQTYDRDDWLTSVFAAAAGPFVDTAFADRILTRLQRRDRIRTLVLFGTIVAACALMVGLGVSVSAVLPALDLDLIKLPEWLANTRAIYALAGVTAAAFTVWMVVEEA